MVLDTYVKVKRPQGLHGEEDKGRTALRSGASTGRRTAEENRDPENKPLTVYQKEVQRKLRRHFQTVQNSPLRFTSVEFMRNRQKLAEKYAGINIPFENLDPTTPALGVPTLHPPRETRPTLPSPPKKPVTEKPLAPIPVLGPDGVIPFERPSVLQRPATAGGTSSSRQVLGDASNRHEATNIASFGERRDKSTRTLQRPSTASGSRTGVPSPVLCRTERGRSAIPKLAALPKPRRSGSSSSRSHHGPSGLPGTARAATARNSARSTSRGKSQVSARSLSSPASHRSPSAGPAPRYDPGTRRSSALSHRSNSAASTHRSQKGFGDGELTITEEHGTYSGGVKRGHKHGHGVFKWTSGKWGGDKYEGQFERGVRHGHGVYTYANGNQYDGDWFCGRREGHGRFNWFTGDWYEGEWLQDTMCGLGKKVWPTGDTYAGLWMDGKRHGMGKYTYKNSGNTYEGEYFNNVKHGSGVVIFANGDRFEGTYVNDMKNGMGKLYRKRDGRVFSEEWRDDVLLKQIKE